MSLPRLFPPVFFKNKWYAHKHNLFQYSSCSMYFQSQLEVTEEITEEINIYLVENELYSCNELEHPSGTFCDLGRVKMWAFCLYLHHDGQQESYFWSLYRKKKTNHRNRFNHVLQEKKSQLCFSVHCPQWNLTQYLQTLRGGSIKTQIKCLHLKDCCKF